MPDPPENPELGFLDPGEAAAIALAVDMKADLILIDDHKGRLEAARRGVRVIGTLGILAECHRQDLLDFDGAIDRLRRTNFYASEDLIESIRRKLYGRG